MSGDDEIQIAVGVDVSRIQSHQRRQVQVHRHGLPIAFWLRRRTEPTEMMTRFGDRSDDHVIPSIAVDVRHDRNSSKIQDNSGYYQRFPCLCLFLWLQKILSLYQNLLGLC